MLKRSLSCISFPGRNRKCLICWFDALNCRLVLLACTISDLTLTGSAWSESRHILWIETEIRRRKREKELPFDPSTARYRAQLCVIADRRYLPLSKPSARTSRSRSRGSYKQRPVLFRDNLLTRWSRIRKRLAIEFPRSLAKGGEREANRNKEQ